MSDEQVEGIELIADQELPSDRVIQAIKRREVRKGQFSIVNLFWGMAFVALICGIPNIFGLNQTRYWLELAFLVWVFSPGIIYLVYRAVNTLGFPSVIPWIVCILVGAFTLAAVWINGFVALIVVALWVPQFLVMVWLHRLFVKRNPTAESIKARYEQLPPGDV